jgi:hypothetical protein
MRVVVGQAFDLTRDEIWFLKALLAAGERGRAISTPPSRAGLARLVEMQYVTKLPESERKRFTSSLIAADRP